MQKVNGDGEFAYFGFTVTQPRQFMTVSSLAKVGRSFGQKKRMRMNT